MPVAKRTQHILRLSLPITLKMEVHPPHQNPGGSGLVPVHVDKRAKLLHIYAEFDMLNKSFEVFGGSHYETV